MRREKNSGDRSVDENLERKKSLEHRVSPHGHSCLRQSKKGVNNILLITRHELKFGRHPLSFFLPVTGKHRFKFFLDNRYSTVPKVHNFSVSCSHLKFQIFFHLLAEATAAIAEKTFILLVKVLVVKLFTL